MSEHDNEPGFQPGGAGEPRYLGPLWRQGMQALGRPAPGRGEDWRYGAESVDEARRRGRPPEPDYRGVGPTGYRRSDARIYEDVCERLTEDPRIDASRVEVEVDDGVITLRGEAPDRRGKRLTGFVCATVSGALDVMNEVRVPRRPGGAAPEERAMDAGER